MELKDMTFPQVLALEIFREELEAQMKIELKAWHVRQEKRWTCFILPLTAFHPSVL